MLPLFRRFADELQWRCASLAARITDRDPVSGIRMVRRNDLVTLGTESAGWMVPAHCLAKGSICYCAGVGYDLSFEFELIRRFWCRVFGFDPSQRAKKFVERIGAQAVGYDFHPVALGDSDGVSQTANLDDNTYIGPHGGGEFHRTDKYADITHRRVISVMDELGHDRLALLKLDVDDAVHAVVASALSSGVRPTVLCLSFSNGPDSDRAAISATLRRLVDHAEYDLVATDGRRRFTLARDA